MPSRRHLLCLPVCAAAVWLHASPAAAQARRATADPLRVGVDPALIDSGLARALQQAFVRDTGVAVQLVARPAQLLLEALERGELDAGLTNAPLAEARLEAQGLVHDRQAVAEGGFVIVGPAPRRKGAAVLGALAPRDAVDALGRLRDAPPGSVSYVSAGDGSGTHLLEQSLWREARIAPAPPWYVTLAPGANLIAQARASAAFALVERGAWLAQGGAPLAVWVDGDPRLREAVHAMRAFRVSHAAGKIFVAWIAGPRGQQVVAALRAYGVATAR
jgi:tungstate transport system substrate-binding protein